MLAWQYTNYGSIVYKHILCDLFQNIYDVTHEIQPTIDREYLANGYDWKFNFFCWFLTHTGDRNVYHAIYVDIHNKYTI